MNGALGLVFYYTFTLMCVFIMVNVFLAIIMDAQVWLDTAVPLCVIVSVGAFAN